MSFVTGIFLSTSAEVFRCIGGEKFAVEHLRAAIEPIVLEITPAINLTMTAGSGVTALNLKDAGALCRKCSTAPISCRIRRKMRDADASSPISQTERVVRSRASDTEFFRVTIVFRGTAFAFQRFKIILQRFVTSDFKSVKCCRIFSNKKRYQRLRRTKNGTMRGLRQRLLFGF